jgi:glycosyltransferase involved in cell wall biosynthesis
MASAAQDDETSAMKPLYRYEGDDSHHHETSARGVVHPPAARAIGDSPLPGFPRRIALLCPGLEEGRDGVGDYCRRLAASLVGSGVECLVLALHDQLVTEPAETAMAVGTSLIRIHRLPHRFSMAEKIVAAATILSRWQPDWVSLHFVCYGFHPKGTVFRELYWLPELLAPYRVHLLFHELWIGEGVFRTRMTAAKGAIQRAFMLRLVRRLQPLIVDTTNQFYQALLARGGVKAGILPLFGNIPVTAEPADGWLFDIVSDAGGPDLRRNRQNCWLIAMFGRLVPQWPARALLQRLRDAADRRGVRALIILAGVTGPHTEALVAQWQSEVAGIDLIVIGPRSPAELSQLFNSADFGLTSHPYYALGKSGTVAAMIEHGLPVIASWGHIFPALAPVEPPFDRMIWACDDTLEARLGERQRQDRVYDRVASVARAFIAELAARSRPSGDGPPIATARRCYT